MAHTINVFARKSVCRPVRAVPTECVRWAPQREYLDLEVGRRVGESRDGVLAYLNTGTARVLSHTSCAVMRCAAACCTHLRLREAAGRVRRACRMACRAWPGTWHPVPGERKFWTLFLPGQSLLAVDAGTVAGGCCCACGRAAKSLSLSRPPPALGLGPPMCRARQA